MSVLVVPSDLDPGDFYEEYFEWLMKVEDFGWKDKYIEWYESGHRFDEFIEKKHPELMVPAESLA